MATCHLIHYDFQFSADMMANKCCTFNLSDSSNHYIQDFFCRYSMVLIMMSSGFKEISIYMLLICLIQQRCASTLFVKHVLLDLAKKKKKV